MTSLTISRVTSPVPPNALPPIVSEEALSPTASARRLPLDPESLSPSASSDGLSVDDEVLSPAAPAEGLLAWLTSPTAADKVFFPPLNSHISHLLGDESRPQRYQLLNKRQHSIVLASPQSADVIFGSVIRNFDTIRKLAETHLVTGAGDPIDTGEVTIDIAGDDLEVCYGDKRVKIGVHAPQMGHEGLRFMRLYPIGGNIVRTFTGPKVHEMRESYLSQGSEKELSMEDIIRIETVKRKLAKTQSRAVQRMTATPEISGARTSQPSDSSSSTPSPLVTDRVKTTASLTSSISKGIMAGARSARTARSSSFSGRVSDAVAKAKPSRSSRSMSFSGQASTKKATNKKTQAGASVPVKPLTADIHPSSSSSENTTDTTAHIAPTVRTSIPITEKSVRDKMRAAAAVAAQTKKGIGYQLKKWFCFSLRRTFKM